ncbi:MAG TPA: hypothetical protein PKE17_18960 [Saprospiraceae bacterium]|nr:hypothetical protein [Saprospiraceae bacterium]
MQPIQTFEEYYEANKLLVEAAKQKRGKDKPKRKETPKKSARPFSKPHYWTDSNWKGIHYKPRLG